jgi:hypothetical protein
MQTLQASSTPVVSKLSGSEGQGVGAYSALADFRHLVLAGAGA